MPEHREFTAAHRGQLPSCGAKLLSRRDAISTRAEDWPPRGRGRPPDYREISRESWTVSPSAARLFPVEHSIPRALGMFPRENGEAAHERRLAGAERAGTSPAPTS